MPLQVYLKEPTQILIVEGSINKKLSDTMKTSGLKFLTFTSQDKDRKIAIVTNSDSNISHFVEISEEEYGDFKRKKEQERAERKFNPKNVIPGKRR